MPPIAPGPMIAIVVMPERSPRRATATISATRFASSLATLSTPARPVADRLGDVRRRHAGALLEVGDRARHAQHAMESTCREVQSLGRALEQGARGGIDRRRARRASGRARAHCTRCRCRSAHAAGSARARRARGSAAERSPGSRQASRARLTAGTWHVQVDAVGERTREPPAIPEHLRRGASALVRGVAARVRTGTDSSPRRARSAREIGATRSRARCDTVPSSIGWRSASSTERGNSSSSSRKSTP